MKAKLLALLLFIILLLPHPLSAQALFKGFGVPATAASTGQTEVIGLILAAMTSGPVVADTLLINLYPLQITNASASDLVVRANGVIVGTPMIDTVNDLVEIPVPASISATGSISIEGIRVAVAGTGINTFNARLSWLNYNNVFIDGGSVPVISSVQTPLVARSITNPSSISGGQLNATRSTFQVAEGFPGAFSSSSQYGQTSRTQIQITVADFAVSGQLQFPVTVTANETAATLTISGSPAALAGNGTVTYAYSAADNSGGVAESFNISMDLGSAVSAQPTVHVTLAPIGAAVPNSALPSTSIPRYAEDEVYLDPASSLVPRKILYWTGVNSSLQNQLEVTNPAPRPSNVTIDAFDPKGNPISGTGVTSPVTLTLPANQSLVRSVSNLFGTAAGIISSIRIQSTTPDLLAAAVITGNGLNQSVAFASVPVTSLLFPIVSDSAQLYVMNTTVGPITGTVTLLTGAGDFVSAVTVNLPPLASTVLTAQTFGGAPQSGYASAVFSGSVVAYESFGKGNLELVQAPITQASFFVPFMAGGTNFKPSVKLINVSHETVTLNAGLFATNGSLLAAQPVTLQPAGEIMESIQQMFSQSPDTAYVEFDLPQTGKGFFLSYPLIAGQAQIETFQGGSTVIPFSANLSMDAFILGETIGSAGFEGIAFLNPTTSNVLVTVRAVKFDGSIAATATLTLGARQLTAQLTDQLFNGAPPSQTVIRITSSAPIAVTAITGSTALDQILALPVMW